MNKIFLLFFACLLFAGVWAMSGHHVRGQVMNLSSVCKKWGEQELKVEEFKNNEGVRSKMACSLMKNQKKFIGKDVLEIRSIFGDFTGHYFSESYPTYLVQIAKDKNEDSWQLLYLIDKNQKVSEIVMHKNCCY